MKLYACINQNLLKNKLSNWHYQIVLKWQYTHVTYSVILNKSLLKDKGENYGITTDRSEKWKRRIAY